MRETVKLDLYRYFGLINTKIYLKGWYLPGFRYTFFLRLANLYGGTSFFGLIARLFLRRYSIKYGIQIPRGTKIGKGFYIGHFGSIVVNNRCVIGDNCNLAHNVTIGQENRGEKKGTPTIGNKVWIGTGSVIVGNIKIGNNVLIAPLSFVNIDIPDNSIVVGNPCKIIPSEKATENYINNIIK